MGCMWKLSWPQNFPVSVNWSIPLKQGVHSQAWKLWTCPGKWSGTLRTLRAQVPTKDFRSGEDSQSWSWAHKIELQLLQASSGAGGGGPNNFQRETQDKSFPYISICIYNRIFFFFKAPEGYIHKKLVSAYLYAWERKETFTCIHLYIILGFELKHWLLEKIHKYVCS